MRKITLFIFIILSGCNYNKANDQNINYLDDFSDKIDKVLTTDKPRKFNGVILITKNGKEIYSKAFGFSNFINKTPISLDDNFRIQSNSKQISAVLILKEVEKGRIDLTRSLKQYLPDLNQQWASAVTVHHLLNMSSGIVSINEPLLFKPGTDFYYSNPGYGLLRRVLEKVTGEKFPDMANNLFDELGMENTYSYAINGVNAGLINGYNQSETKYSPVDFDSLGFTNESWANFLPAGGIVSNLKDLNTWDSKLHNGKILSKKAYALMVKSSAARDFHQAFDEEVISYGYGINISSKNPIKYMGHAGTGLGFANLKIYFPESDTNLIILENIYNEDREVNYYFESEIRKIVLNSFLVK